MSLKDTLVNKLLSHFVLPMKATIRALLPDEITLEKDEAENTRELALLEMKECDYRKEIEFLYFFINERRQSSKGRGKRKKKRKRKPELDPNSLSEFKPPNTVDEANSRIKSLKLKVKELDRQKSKLKADLDHCRHSLYRIRANRADSAALLYQQKNLRSLLKDIEESRSNFSRVEALFIERHKQACEAPHERELRQVKDLKSIDETILKTQRLLTRCRLDKTLIAISRPVPILEELLPELISARAYLTVFLEIDIAPADRKEGVSRIAQKLTIASNEKLSAMAEFLRAEEESQNSDCEAEMEPDSLSEDLQKSLEDLELALTDLYGEIRKAIEQKRTWEERSQACLDRDNVDGFSDCEFRLAGVCESIASLTETLVQALISGQHLFKRKREPQVS